MKVNGIIVRIKKLWSKVNPLESLFMHKITVKYNVKDKTYEKIKALVIEEDYFYVGEEVTIFYDEKHPSKIQKIERGKTY